jgi:hypothetical protein
LEDDGEEKEQAMIFPNTSSFRSFKQTGFPFVHVVHLSIGKNVSAFTQQAFQT